MQENQTNRVPLKFLKRSPKGLWVKGNRLDDRIDVSWQRRTVIDGTTVHLTDENGDVVNSMQCANIEWGDEWVSAGSIIYTDGMVEMAKIKDFERFCFGMMRHVVCLSAGGYGDSIADVVEWFKDICAAEFIIDGEYKIVDSHGDIADMAGNIITVDRDDSGKLNAEIIVRERRFPFDLNIPSTLTSFIITTIPI